MPTVTRGSLTEEQVASFDRDGYLLLRNWVTGDLLASLKDAGDRWIRDGLNAPKGSPDYQFAHREIGEVFFRVDYLHDKGEPASLALLGSPEVLGVAESMLGPNYVPTYEAMVFKQAGDGEVIRWHQDAVHARKHRVYNYDLYLDRSIKGMGALQVIPGSQRQPFDPCAFEQEHGWSPPGQIWVEMEPGDVLLHDVMVVHGSARTQGNALRRTIYYEFRAAEMIEDEGPWDAEWVAKRQALLPIAKRTYEQLFGSDRSTFDYASLEAELRVVHTEHMPGSYCSASSL